MNSDNTATNRRKEPRFKKCDGQSLTCDVEDFLEQGNGTIIDLSKSGLRFLSENKLEPGQEFTAELKTDRGFGSYRGVVRNVNLWYGGEFAIGCELLEPLSDEVLTELIDEGVISRRHDSRVKWNQPAKMSWQLQSGEVDVDIQDCSRGGLRVASRTKIPENVSIRMCLDLAEQGQYVIKATSIWSADVEEGFEAGLAFVGKSTPDVVANVLADNEGGSQGAKPARRVMRTSILSCAVIVILAEAIKQIYLNFEQPLF